MLTQGARCQALAIPETGTNRTRPERKIPHGHPFYSPWMAPMAGLSPATDPSSTNAPSQAIPLQPIPRGPGPRGGGRA